MIDSSLYNKIDEFKSVDFSANVEVYRHILTSLRVIRVRCKDKETFFSYSFPTPPGDSSGVFHIIEHTCLSGSKNFPIKDPFNVAMAQTSCSFLNAMTYSNFTTYPASGKVLHDLEKIFLMYGDAVFFPLLQKSAFLQEGIRYKCDKRGNVVDFDGVVFNEMSENYSSRIETAIRFKNSICYQSTSCQHESGGDINYIPLLKYENYKNIYKKFYNPQSCTLVLYGDDDCDYFLDLLDKFLLKSDRNEYSLPDKNSNLFISQQSASDTHDNNVACFDKKDNKYPSFFFLFPLSIPFTDHITYRAFGIMVQAILSQSKSDLYKELTDYGFFKDISSLSGLERKEKIAYFILGFDDIITPYSDKVEVENICKNALFLSLQKIVKRGISKNELLSAIKNIKLENMERVSSFPFGIKITERVMRAGDDDIKLFFDILDDIRIIEENFKKDEKYFDKIFEEYIFKNKNYKTLFLQPDDSFDEKLRTKKNDLLSLINKNCTPSGLVEDEKIFNDYVSSNENFDTEKYFSFATADELIKYAEYDNLEIENIEGATVLFKQNGLSRLSYINIVFDVSDFEDEEIKKLNILSQLLADNAKMDLRDKFFSKLYYYAHDLDFSCFSTSTTKGECKIFYKISFKCLDEDLATSLELLFEFITSFKITQKGLVQTLNEIYSYFNEDFASLAPSFSISLASSPYSLANYYNNIVSGLGFKEYSQSIKKSSLKDGVLQSDLKALSGKIFSKKRCVFHIMAKENQIVAIKKFISALFDDSKGEIKLKSNITPCEIRTYPITGNVSYSAMAFPTKKCSPAYDVFSTVIQNTKLWQKIRIEGGAYGARCDYGYFSGLFVISSYRDPRFKESFDDFISALDIDVTSQMLKKSKDSFFVDLANEPTNEKKAFYSIRNYLINLTNDMRKERFEKALSLTLAQAKAEMKALIEYSKTNSKASITPFGQI